MSRGALTSGPAVVHLLGEPHHDGGPVHVPEGAHELGERVPVRLRVPTDHPASAVHLRQVHDGEPVLSEATLDRVEDDARWYVAEVEVHNPVTSYRFLVDGPGGHRWLNGRGPHPRDVPDAADFRLTAYPTAPGWARDAVVYQVFPDRFARSGTQRPVPDWAEPASWSDEPIGSGPSTPRQLYGGDLAGIEQRLDHLERLGADVLYLTPFFPARSNHRYDASSFDHVDPILGGDRALASLARAVHARGMRLMGDLTTNHTGDAHEWFRRALADPTCEEARYYLWQDQEPGYVGWLGHASLPKLDHTSPRLAARLVDGPDSVIARWLREPFSLDGWRVDVANMTGRYRDTDVTHEVARRIRATLTSTAPDALLVAEHFHDASGDLPGDGWHATMNYNGFARPVWSWLATPGTGIPVHGLPVTPRRRPGADVVASMREFAAVLPWAVTSHQWNLLGSHDTARIRSVLGSDPALLDAAVTLLMTYPGTPMVFAGDEVGAHGTNGEHGRTTMPWDEPARWDDPTFALYAHLTRIRRASEALRRGGLRWVLAADEAVGYLRETPEERVLVVVARGPWAGVTLPRSLLTGTPQTLHGPDLRVDARGLHVSGEGPAAGVWRLA